jgi:Abnormal spindle-like microcephaly-assoc'd, ASPM-SPD-2-Hydin/Beta-propeller repeat/Cep192 domain 4
MMAVKSKGTVLIIFYIVAAFISAQSVLAQQPVIQHSTGQTAQVAVPIVSEAWSSTLVPSVSGQKKRQTRFIGHYPGYRTAKKAANQRVTGRTSSQAQSTTTQSLSLAPQAPSVSTLVFDGPSESDTPYIPPDSQVAAGPTYVVAVINSLMAIYAKTGVQQGGFQQLSSFFSSLGVNGEIFDPRILYDQTDNRFILSVAEVDMTNLTNGHVLIAVSQTSDPRGVWNKFAINFMGRNLSNTDNTFPDFPTLGLNSSAVYISTGQFAMNSACMSNNTCSFSDTWIKMIGLPALLAGNSTLNITTFENVTTATGGPAFSIEPAVTYGNAPGEFLVAAGFTSNPGANLNVFEINTSGTPALSTVNLTVPQFSMPPDATQSGSGFQIATNDFRLLNAVWSNGSLWCGQNVYQPAGLGVAARWYQIAATSLGTVSLTQTGDVTGSGDGYFPALSVNSGGDVGMVFTTSGPTHLASAAFTGRAASDPPNTMRTFSIYRAGTDDYVDFATRWGDYSGISLDPGGSNFWMIAEYAGSPNPHFGTAIAQTTGAPSLNLSTTVLDFGSETINVPSAPLPVTITNSNNASLTLGNATISGGNPSVFAISSDGCSNVTLASGESCTLNVTFTPVNIGTASAMLELNTNPAELPMQVYLTGLGAVATGGLNVSPTTITFPDTPAHTSSAPQIVEVTNTSSSPESLEIYFHASNPPFTQTNNCGSSLPAGQKCQISLVFRPTSASTFYGTSPAELEVLYQGFPTGVSIPTVEVYGTSVVAPLSTLCPTSINFGSQTVGATSPPQAVTVNNSGTSALTVSGISISGDFAETNTCGTLPATLPSGMGCTISVTFTPTAAGTSTGTLTVTDNATGSPQTAQLTGTGVTSAAQNILPLHKLRLASGDMQIINHMSSTIRPPPVHVRRSSRLEAARYGKLALGFEANHGQTDSRVKFLSRGGGYTMFLTDRGAVLKLWNNRPRDRSRHTANPAEKSGSHPSSRSGVIRMTLAGTNARARVYGLDELPGKANYLIGNDPRKWKTNVPIYAKVKYHNIYPGTDLVYYGNQHRLEYDFVLAPVADPNAIRLRIETPERAQGKDGQDSHLRIAPNGDLVIPTAGGEVRFRTPVVYQPGETRPQSTTVQKHYLKGRFVLRKVVHSGYEAAFQIASYDRSRPLVIDPVLSYSTYLGGSGKDEAHAIAVDASGSAYVVGTTASADFPVANALQTKINRTLPSDTDAFVTKLSPDGTSLVYSTFLGGTRGEEGNSVGVDSQGNVYVGGETGSSDFPISKAAIQTKLKGGTYYGDGFIAKIDSTGSALLYSTYFGGSGDDSVNALATDSSGDAYIAGVTTSSDLFTTSGSPQTRYADNGDAFVAEINPQGTGAVYSTYLGGGGYDYANSIAVDSTGSAYVAGTTDSLDFPTTPGAYQGWLSKDGRNAFITKIKPLGAGLAYSTYLGGSGNGTSGGNTGEVAYGIAVDTQGDAYVAGATNSTDFPSVNPIQIGRPVYWSTMQAFVTKLHPAGCGLVYSTRLGGFFYSSGTGIAVDPGGDAYVTGWTDDFEFPVLNPFQASYRQVPSGGALHTEGFVSELAPTGSSLIYSSYLGGTTTDLPTGYGGGDFANSIAIDAAGNAYIAGETDSIDFPVVNGADPTYRGSRDGFVTKVAPTVVPSITLAPSALIFPDTAVGTTSAPVYVTLTNTTSNPVTISSVTSQPGNPHYAVASNSCNTTVQPGASCAFGVTFSPVNNGLDWSWVTVSDNAFAAPHSVPLYGTGYSPATIVLYGNQPHSEYLATPPGTTATSQILVENTGNQPLTISSINVTGTGFSQTNNCTSAMSFQGQCSVELTFAPTAAGTVIGTLTVAGNAVNSPQTLPLTGVGQDFAIGATPGTSSSATVTAGQSATYSVDVSAPSSFNQLISLACSGAPAHATCTIDKTGITLYGTTPVTAKVTVSTTARSMVPNGHRLDGPWGFGVASRRFPLGLLVLLAALVAAAMASGRFAPSLGCNQRALVRFSAIVLLVLLWATCGGGGAVGGGGGGSSQQTGTPAGTYTLTVSGTSGSLTHTTTVKLTVQ